MSTDDLSKLLDEKLQPISSELETLNGRLEAVEDVIERTKPSGFRVLEIQSQLKKIEKRMTQLSGKMDKAATKDDLKRLDKKLGDLIEHVDGFASNTAQRVRHIERHVDTPPFEPIPMN